MQRKGLPPLCHEIKVFDPLRGNTEAWEVKLKREEENVVSTKIKGMNDEIEHGEEK